MPEISARDLRRLEALEGRLTKAQDARKALASERHELRAAVAACERRARALEKDTAAKDERLEAVLAENAAQAARLEESRADLERFQQASLELRAELDSARAELNGIQAALKTAQGELEAAKSERDGLADNLQLANEQLAGKEITPVLPAKEVANLVDRFISELDSGLPQLAIRDSEVRLQVAFGKVGRITGFVIPSAESPPEVRENLHELAIRFERSPESGR